MITIIQKSKHPKILSIGMAKLSTGMAFEKYLPNSRCAHSVTNGVKFKNVVWIFDWWKPYDSVYEKIASPTNFLCKISQNKTLITVYAQYINLQH